MEILDHGTIHTDEKQVWNSTLVRNEIMNDQAWYAAHINAVFALFFLFDTIVFLKFATDIEKQIADCWEELRRGHEYSSSKSTTSVEEDEDETSISVPSLGSQISLDYVYVFVSHQVESFLRRRSYVDHKSVKKSTCLNIIYLLATASMSCCVASFIRYEMVKNTSNGSFCFISDYPIGDYSYYDDIGWNSSLSEDEASKIPESLRSWAFGHDPWNSYINHPSFVQMDDGDIFFKGSSIEHERTFLLRKKRDGNVLISYPHISEHWRNSFILDEKQSNVDTVSRFCLFYTEAGFHFDMVLCHPSNIELSSGTFLNVSLHNRSSPGCHDWIGKLEDGVLVTICMQDGYHNGSSYHPRSRVIQNYNASTMEIMSQQFALQMSSKIVSDERDESSKFESWCESTYLLIFTVVEAVMLTLAGLTLMKVKQLPVGVVVMFVAGGFILRHLPFLFELFYALVAIFLLSSLLNEKPNHPEWLSREVSWWLVYSITVLFWLLLLDVIADGILIEQHDPDPVFEDEEIILSVLCVLFLVQATFLLAPLLLLGKELPRPEWLAPFCLVPSVLVLLIIIILALVVCDDPLVVVNISILLLLCIKSGHPIINTLHVLVTTVSTISIPIIFMSGGDFEMALACLVSVFLVIGLKVVAVQIIRHRFLFAFLWRDILNKMKTKGKKIKREDHNVDYHTSISSTI